MPTLANAVLPLIRTRTDLHRWSASNAHGRQMHEAVDILEAAVATTPPGEVYTVTHKALTSAITVIARADDSSGIIGHACRRLLELHPRAAAAAQTPPPRLVDWMMKFQFDSDVDYFELDPVAYAPALGETGMQAYRARLDDVRHRLGPRPHDRWDIHHRHEWFVIEWNEQRLAVLDHDIDAIIATHAKDRKVAAWYEDTAEALEEIGEIDLAIDWARQGMDVTPSHQAQKCGESWSRLLREHRPDEWLEARRTVFDRWPTHSTAARLHEAAGPAWAEYHDHVFTALEDRPSDAVLFALTTLKEPQLAWDLAHQLALDSDHTWNELIETYQTIDPTAVLPIHTRLVLSDLVDADARRYRAAARRLATMRLLAAGTEHASRIDTLISDLREEHRRRPRLQQEFNRAGLP